MSTAELRDAGLTPRGISDRVRGGRLFVVWRGAYSVGHEPLTDEAWFRAAEVALDAVLSHRSAAALWGFRKRGEREPVEVTVARGGVRGRAGLVVHRTTRPDPRWTRRNGIRVTSAEQTLLDLASVAPYRDARRAVGQALIDRRVSILSLIAQLEASNGHRGSKHLKRIIETAQPTRSEAEDLLNALLREAGLTSFEMNHHVEGVGELDACSPEHRYALEFDGAMFHDNPITRADDRAKTQRANDRGIRIDRLRWRDITTHRHRTTTRIRTTLDEQFQKNPQRPRSIGAAARSRLEETPSLR